MHNSNRAKQFMPFDALKGFRQTMDFISKQIEFKKSLSDDYIKYLNNKLCNLKKGDIVVIKYYYLTEYIETRGIVKKIDNVYKKIYLSSSIINFDDILEINVSN